MNRLSILMVALLGIGIVSCQKSTIVPLDPIPGEGGTKGERVEVTLKLSTAPIKSKSTTSLTQEQEHRVVSLWVFQFDRSDGTASGEPVYVDCSDMDPDQGVPVSLTQADVPQILYLLANSSGSTAFLGDKAPATEAELNNRMLKTDENLDRGQWAGLPMMARSEVPAIAAGNTIYLDPLEQLFAKIRLTLTNEIPEMSDFVLDGVRLRNVSVFARYRPEPTGEVNFPAVAEGEHTDYPFEEFPAGASEQVYTWYVPENLRTLREGQSVNSEQERLLGKTDGKATYIEIIGRDKNGPVHFQWPIGDVGTSLSDFNVRRNNLYTMNIAVRGFESADPRITTLTKAPANSFMVLPGQTIKFDARVVGNGGNDAGTGLATTIDPAGVRLVWEDAQGLITNASTIPLEDGMATIETAADMTGNALVAAYSGPNGTGTILWSWHIWVTDYAPKAQTSVSENTAYTVLGGEVHTYGPNFTAAYPGKVIMDRDLGAIKAFYNGAAVTAADAPKALGFYYQYGRKDPMGRWDGTSTTSPALTPWYGAAGNAVTSEIANGAVTLQTAIQNPTKFYGSYVSPYDWSSPSNSNLWENGGEKTIFDPCPAGWKVVSYKAWEDFWDVTGNTLNVSVDEMLYGDRFPYFIDGRKQTAAGVPAFVASARNGRIYQQGSVRAWYPAMGHRSVFDGMILNSGKIGYNWSGWFEERHTGPHSVVLYYSDAAILPGGTGEWIKRRGDGYSVRCISE